MLFSDGGANPEERAIETVKKGRKPSASYREVAAALLEGGLMTRTGGRWNLDEVRRIAERWEWLDCPSVVLLQSGKIIRLVVGVHRVDSQL